MAKTVLKPNDSRVAAACKAVLRYLAGNGLIAGDGLPNQQELRVELGFSNDTLTLAMRQLVQAGVLTRKSKVGTIVADPGARLTGLWFIAIAVFPNRVMIEAPFFSQLIQFLQGRIREAGYRCQAYPLMRESLPALPGLGDFAGLEEDMEAGAVDGVLTPSIIAPAAWETSLRQGVPICHVGSWAQAPCGVVIDQHPMAARAVRLLHEERCKRLALVAGWAPRAGDGAFDGFDEAARALGSAVKRCDPLGHGPGVKGGEKVAAQLLAMDRSERPDGLVVVDDRVAMGLTATLTAAGDYRPLIAVQANLQAPVSFALPVFRFNVDIEEMAVAASTLLLERVSNPALPERVIRYVPRFSGLRADEHPRS